MAPANPATPPPTRTMKLYIAPRAPNPRRVQMFMAEKGITDIPQVAVDLNAGEHRGEAFRAKSPLAKVPALEFDDGRVLTETRAICTCLEGRHPEPNLMGVDFDERAFIEMADRRIEFYLMAAAGQLHPPHPPRPGGAGAAAVSRLRAQPGRQGVRGGALAGRAAGSASPSWPVSVSPSPTSPRFVGWNLRAGS